MSVAGNVSVEHEAETDDEFLIVDIDSLQNQGINVADLKKLKSAGICTIRGLKMNTKKKLCQIKGLSEAKVDKIKEAIAKLEGGQGSAAFVTALQVLTLERSRGFTIREMFVVKEIVIFLTILSRILKELFLLQMFIIDDYSINY